MIFLSTIEKFWKLFLEILFAACLLVFPALFANGSNKLDSLLSELNKPSHDTIKFELLLEIGDCYYFNDFDTANVYFMKARKLAEINLENLDKSDKSLERKFMQQKAKAIRYIAYVYQNQGDLITASEMYFEALEIGESIGCSLNIYNSFNNIAIINYKRGEYDLAKEYFDKAIEITEKMGNRFGRMKLFNNMGVLLYDMGNATDSIPERIAYYQAARENFNEALKLRIEFNDRWGQMLCYNNLGNLIRDDALLLNEEKAKLSKLSQAANFYRKSFSLAKELNDLMGMSKANGNKSELFLILYSLSVNYENKVYADSAVIFATEAYRYADELNSLPQKNKAALTAKKACETSGYTRKALRFANIYIQTSDELFSEEKTKSLDEMRIKYETEKKENEIQLLSKKNELKEIVIRNSKRELILFVFIAFFSIAFSALLLILYFNRRKIGKLLKTKNEELNALNTTKDKFISILAHDLKNPFTAFLNITSVLNNDFDEIDNSHKKKYIKKLHQSALQINSLLKNMLEWAVIKHKTVLPNFENLNLYKTVDYTIQILTGFVSEHNALIVNSISTNINVYANKNHLIAILNNLITNAVKFSKNDKTVTLSAFIDHKNALIIVEDKGIGITSNDVEKLFRIDVDTNTIGNGKIEYKGTGMGLILCKELIDKMNGEIYVESELNKGSKFILTLPLKLEGEKNNS
jgi:signal transduction histidine kinase/Tfp pilus assembly protein PilF